MIKLAFEQLIEDLSLNQNFELIYEFIKTFGEHLETINIRITDKKSLKSNHYWLMAIIPKLKSLKNIRLIESAMRSMLAGAHPGEGLLLVDLIVTNKGRKA